MTKTWWRGPEGPCGWPEQDRRRALEDDLFDCPFCPAEDIVRADALIFGCLSCGATFWEEAATVTEFESE